MQVDITLNPLENRQYTVFIDELNTLSFDCKVLIVTNTTVGALHSAHLQNLIKAREVHTLILKDGEVYKNLESLSEILNACFEHKLDRKSLLIALGGGVIGDMTGFAASIYLRGIDFIQIPTTLLAQVDASVGGKTGINNAYGKNLIGSFWQPRAVYCESAFLKTLPAREFAAGIAEIIKMAVTFDRPFFEWLETHDVRESAHLKYAIHKSICIKANVVACDETEQGIRAVLNYGHTFAHVIEHQTHYTGFLHGEAVAIGMVMANALSCNVGLLTQEEARRIQNLLERYDLPTTYDIASLEAFYTAFFLDKKSANDAITFILAQGIGAHQMRKDIPKETVLEALKAFHA